MKKLDGLKVLSIITMIGGAAVSLLSDVTKEKTMQKTIEEEVKKALDKTEK